MYRFLESPNAVYSAFSGFDAQREAVHAETNALYFVGMLLSATEL